MNGQVRRKMLADYEVFFRADGAAICERYDLKVDVT